MIEERIIILKNTNYYIGIELKYNKKMLCKKDGSYFDCGDFTHLIENIEQEYKKEEIYDKDIPYMNDIIFIYNHFPFLSYIKDISYDKNNQISRIGIIYKKEIQKYIKQNHITFKKYDGTKSVSPLLFSKTITKKYKIK